VAVQVDRMRNAANKRKILDVSWDLPGQRAPTCKGKDNLEVEGKGGWGLGGLRKIALVLND
jgi:hypothetical protein